MASVADEMLTTLRRTNDNIAAISDELLLALRRINSSAALTELLNDRTIPANLKASLTHLHETTEKASALMNEAGATLALASEGRGPLATLLTDTTLASEVQLAVRQIREVESGAERLASDLNKVVASVDRDFNQGSGTVNALMKDSSMADNLRRTLENAEKGTAAFSANMEALKHNFLFRRYFKKLEKQRKKAEKDGGR